MKIFVKSMAAVGVLTTAFVASAQAGVGDNIENWRSIEGVESSRESAPVKNSSFVGLPREIWDWREKENVEKKRSVFQQHIHTGARNRNYK